MDISLVNIKPNAGVKNQGAELAAKRIAQVRSHSRGVPESLYVKKKKREASLNPFRKMV